MTSTQRLERTVGEAGAGGRSPRSHRLLHTPLGELSCHTQTAPTEHILKWRGRQGRGRERDALSGGLMGPGAEAADSTAGAVWPLGLADGPTVEDKEVGDKCPLLPGNHPAELLFDLVLLVALSEA